MVDRTKGQQSCPTDGGNGQCDGSEVSSSLKADEMLQAALPWLLPPTEMQVHAPLLYDVPNDHLGLTEAEKSGIDVSPI